MKNMLNGSLPILLELAMEANQGPTDIHKGLKEAQRGMTRDKGAIWCQWWSDEGHEGPTGA